MKKLIVLCLALSLFAVGCSGLSSTRPEQSIYVATLPLEDCKKVIEAIEEETIPEIKSIHIEEAIMFDFDSSEIRDDQVAKLDSLTKLLSDTDIFVIIDGYASKEGSAKYNQTLSEKRAKSVKAELVNRGIDADRIKTVTGKGATSIFGELLELNRKAIVVSIK